MGGGIPAYTGNTGEVDARFLCIGSHPRMYGEYTSWLG